MTSVSEFEAVFLLPKAAGKKNEFENGNTSGICLKKQRRQSAGPLS